MASRLEAIAIRKEAVAIRLFATYYASPCYFTLLERSKQHAKEEVEGWRVTDFYGDLTRKEWDLGL